MHPVPVSSVAAAARRRHQSRFRLRPEARTPKPWPRARQTDSGPKRSESPPRAGPKNLQRRAMQDQRDSQHPLAALFKDCIDNESRHEAGALRLPLRAAQACFSGGRTARRRFGVILILRGARDLPRELARTGGPCRSPCRCLTPAVAVRTPLCRSRTRPCGWRREQAPRRRSRPDRARYG